MPNGGWAWRSSIQAPHFHTDRDVGAASVGEGLLAAYAVTGDSRYLRAAARAGDYLLGVAEPADGGLRWPDWADADGRRSSTHYTSFDDGAAGISDFLWKLSEATNDSRFRDGALAGMHWLLAQAKGGYSKPCPSVCVWRWTDDPSSEVTYSGVGMGQGGIILALDAFADRTGDQTFWTYARAGAAYLQLLTANGTRPLPEQPGTTSYVPRLPLGLSRSGKRLPRPLRARSLQDRPRSRPQAVRLGERPGERGSLRAALADHARPGRR